MVAMVEFPSNGGTGGGYLAPAHEGAGQGVRCTTRAPKVRTWVRTLEFLRAKLG